MNKTFLTSEQIHTLIKEGEKACGRDNFSRLKKIGDKYGLILNGSKKENLNAVFREWIKLIDKEQPGSAFRKEWNNRYPSTWATLRHTAECMNLYIKHIGCQDEYEFLCNICWDKLADFASNGAKKFGVVDSSSYRMFIDLGGDYSLFFGQFGSENCDPELIKESEMMYEVLNTLLANMTDKKKLYIINALKKMSYANISKEQFHNILNG